MQVSKKFEQKNDERRSRGDWKAWQVLTRPNSPRLSRNLPGTPSWPQPICSQRSRGNLKPGKKHKRKNSSNFITVWRRLHTINGWSNPCWNSCSTTRSPTSVRSASNCVLTRVSSPKNCGGSCETIKPQPSTDCMRQRRWRTPLRIWLRSRGPIRTSSLWPVNWSRRMPNFSHYCERICDRSANNCCRIWNRSSVTQKVPTDSV